jgi:hypothetical protein
LGSAGLLRRSPLPPEKQGNDGANPKAWIWPEQTRASPPKRRHKAHYNAKLLLDLHLRPPAPPSAAPDQPRRRERRQIGPTIELSLGYCSEGGGGKGGNILDLLITSTR